MAHILIIDDEELFAETVADKLASLGHQAQCSACLAEGIVQADKGEFDIILLDVRLPDGNGLEAIHRLRAVKSEPQIIIITGAGDPDGAELAIRHGAWCYLEKTSILKEMVLPITRAQQYRLAAQGQQGALTVLKREHIIGDSPSLRHCLDQLGKAAVSSADVLVTGESGTGKELFARAIHTNSTRCQGNFVVVDCAALPTHLVESILFGHVQGAFTGAEHTNRGLISHADKGTLFLDEVGELPLSTQKTFLRVLQERFFRPVGGQKETKSDFRLICATNRDLDSLTDQGLFREDLLHRLRGMVLHLPPLRRRIDDLQQLVDHFLARLCLRYGQPIKEYQSDFMDYLQAYDWPGNIRELSQTLEATFAEAVNTPNLFPQHLPLRIQTVYARTQVNGHRAPAPVADELLQGQPVLSWREAKADFEKKYLQHLLQQSGENKSKAAKLSGLSRNRLYQLLNKHQPPGAA